MDVAVRLEGRTARRWAGRGARAVSVAAATGLLALLVVIPFSGSRLLIVRSDSMAPAVAAGDLILTRMVRPGDVAVGDVVTFQDPTREGTLVTHRVIQIQRHGDRYDVVTRGDRNSGTESWSIPANGRLGKLRLRLPSLGYPLGWVGSGPVRSALVVVGSLLLGVGAIRWIWRR